MSSSVQFPSSATPTQGRPSVDGRLFDSQNDVASIAQQQQQQPAPRHTRNGRSLSGGTSAASLTLGFRGASFAPSGAPPGSFSSDLRSIGGQRSGGSRADLSTAGRGTASLDEDHLTTTEQRQAFYREKIAKELKIKLGTENMLEALLSKNAKQTKDQRLRVESELAASNRKIAQLEKDLEEEQERGKEPISPPARSRLSSLFRGSPLRSPSKQAFHESNDEEKNAEAETESPTYVLAEILQALEVEGMQADYYIERANNLVELFKRHPTLKYDLVWSIFGLRVQMMLLSESREVIAAGYRLTRYAIADRKSLQTIRALRTDEMVILSLVKESRANIEREQALKFVRAFIDVKDGIREISKAVVRTIAAVAEHREDRLRGICLMTLAELLVKDPALVVAAGAISPLHEALYEGDFGASESLAASFLHILDTPHRRKFLRSGHELEAVFAPFTDPLIVDGKEEKLKAAAKAISSTLKTWPGLISLSANNGQAICSLLESLQYPSPVTRDLIMELLFDVLRIKPPSWSGTYLAGRRLTTYGRVAKLEGPTLKQRARSDSDPERNRVDLTQHFCALILAMFIKAGLVDALQLLIDMEEDRALKRKATLLLTEVLKMAHHSLPQSVSAKLQVLPGLLPLKSFEKHAHSETTGTIYQIESINRTMNRSGASTAASGKVTLSEEATLSMLSGDQSKIKLNANMDEGSFRAALLDTNILNTVNFIKWKWDLIHSLVEGPLTNPKRMDEAIKGSKFMKRLVGFYRPFKYRFSMVRNTKPNQRYVRTGCALMRTLTQTPEGLKYLVENKLLRQIAECLAQVDRTSGLTSATPLFSAGQMSETLSGGYFAMLGALSSDQPGLAIMERWRMFNMFYNITDLTNRDDLIQTFLGNMDFTLPSHLRVMLSKTLTGSSKHLRLFATRLLRKYAVGSASLDSKTQQAHWVIRLLITQLYDPDMEVCQVAVKILEEACDRKEYLEHVVKCRPALDHLGEIGAPLLLRFLSTSVGYHYLDGLDYITQEMDDWFLGRNDTYVTFVEASLSRAYIDQPRRNSFIADDYDEVHEYGLVPPHFYRELARTKEGCELLQQSGHFSEFASIIRDFDLSEEDPETLLKVKGCLWAIGNVGSMQLGGPFLEESDVVRWIVRIAEGAHVMTMRGTAFFVLGLVSRSAHGLEMLFECGWDAAINSRGESLGFCMPVDLNRLVDVSLYVYFLATFSRRYGIKLQTELTIMM